MNLPLSQWLYKSLKWYVLMGASNKAVVPGRGGNCLERSKGGWRRTWGIVWALTHLSREDDSEGAYFFCLLFIRRIRLWGRTIPSLGCGYIGMLVAQKLAVFSINF